MIVARTRAELSEALRALRASQRAIALVPTMGAIHRGHASLVERAETGGGGVVATIFVNPLQFGPSEDLARYPRDESADLEALEAAGTHLVFVPEEDVVYPFGPPTTTVDPGPMGDVLCGRHRPGHFRGVLTVVAKLFGLVRPDRAVFGRKDFQQAVLVRRMVRDLELGIDIDIVPTVREPDGLAMSSRNQYLDPEERREAPALFRALSDAREAFASGERSPAALKAVIERRLAEHPIMRVQYVEIVDPSTLDTVDEVGPDEVAAVAAFAGTTRLIDNLELGRDS